MRAFFEIVKISFGDKYIRISRAAYWYAFGVIVVFVLAFASLLALLVVNNAELAGVATFFLYLVGIPLGIWWITMQARRIRDVGFRALFYYVFVGISFILPIISLGIGLDDVGFLALISMIFSLVGFGFFFITLMPTNEAKAARFGKAPQYKHNVLKEAKIFFIIFGGILALIALAALGKFSYDKATYHNDGCEISVDDKTQELGILGFNSPYYDKFYSQYTDDKGRQKIPKDDILRTFAKHFDADSLFGGRIESPERLPNIDFRILLPKFPNGTLQCYKDNEKYLSLTLKDSKIEGEVWVKNYNREPLTLTFENNKIKDGKVAIYRQKGKNYDMHLFQEREYKNGKLESITFNDEWKTKVSFVDNKLHGNFVENGRDVVPYFHGLLFGVGKRDGQDCFMAHKIWCQERVEIRGNKKIYYDEHNKRLADGDFYRSVQIYYDGENIKEIKREGFEVDIFDATFTNGKPSYLVESGKGIRFYDDGIKQVGDYTNKSTAYIKFMLLYTPPYKITKINKNGIELYQPQDKNELISLVQNEGIKLDSIDTSKITDMSYLFYDGLELLFAGEERVDFSGIESWDTSNVTTMKYMFHGKENFDKSLDKWNVSKVKNMYGMFDGTPMQNNPPKWYKK